MKNQILGLLFVSLAAGLSACTINMGTNSANAPTSNNTANNAAAPATAKPSEPATAKKPEQKNDAKGERIEFVAGKFETSLKRTVPANGSLDFVLNAGSGQRLQYSVNYNGDDTDLSAFLTEPGSQDISKDSAANENNEFIIKKTGDHRITIQNTTNKPISVDLGIHIK